MSEEEFPEWVKVRAAEIANAEILPGQYKWRVQDVDPGYSTLIALARLVLKYEQEPVDPDLVKAREIVSKNRPAYAKEAIILNGAWDTAPMLVSTLEGIKYGRSQGV